MNQEPNPYQESRDADLQEEADRYQEWADTQLLQEHLDHPEHFHKYPTTNPPTMLSKTHALTERITNALGPIFHATPDYKTILDAMCLVMARVIQSSPNKGGEFELLDKAHNQMTHCLDEFLKLERQQEARENLLDKGIDAFTEFAGAQAEREEGGFDDHPDNGPVRPPLDVFTPEEGLAAINGGMGDEACQEAEKTQAEASWGNSEIHKEIAEHEWLQEILEKEGKEAGSECEDPAVGPDGDPGYHPDGPRAYL